MFMHICKHTHTHKHAHTQMYTHIQCRLSMVVHTYNQHLGGRSRMIAKSLRPVVYVESFRLNFAVISSPFS